MKVAIALAVAFLAYPFVFSNAFYLDIGVALLLAAISASAWNIVGGYAGQVSVGHCMFFGVGAYLPLLVYHHWQLPPIVGIPIGIAVSLVLAVIIGLPTFRLSGHYFSMATIAVAELIRLVVGTWDFARRGDRPARAGGRARLVGPDVPRRAPVLLHLPRRFWRWCCSSSGRSSAPALATTCAPSRRASAPRARSACRCGAPSSMP